MSVNTVTTASSRLKQKYNKGISNIIPSSNDFHKRVEFRKDLEGGASAEFDVQLSHEAGHNMSSDGVTTTLAGAVAQVSARASVTGYPYVLQAQFAYSLISRAGSEDKAFTKIDRKYMSSVESAQNRAEWMAINGRQGVGKVLTNTAGALVITKATWCPAFWSAQIGATFVAFDALTGSTQHDGNVVVSAVDTATRTVTVTGTSTSIVAGDFLCIKNMHAAGRIGLLDIAKNTGSLYGISAATYPLWSANSDTSIAGSSSLTIGKILSYAGLSANKGCSGTKLVCYVPPLAFMGLVSDESQLIRHNAGVKKAETGFETIEVHSPTGLIEIVPHIFMPAGTAVMFPEDYTYLIGSSELTSQLSKGQQDDLFFDLEGSDSKESRLYSDYTVFCERPGYITVMERSDGLALHE